MTPGSRKDRGVQKKKVTKWGEKEKEGVTGENSNLVHGKLLHSHRHGRGGGGG